MAGGVATSDIYPYNYHARKIFSGLQYVRVFTRATRCVSGTITVHTSR